ncbi:unnamed protein product [marine sediment metagenome]|uniref:Uncharacterized protein n=1 Tax=marine sediment metagenome TaxID=412755 RepID=X1RAA1_9ZZZZ
MPTYPVKSRGIGKPDYSKDISRSIQRPGYYLKVGQWLTMSGLTLSDIPSYYGWIKTPLAPGASLHLIDFQTGLPYPYTTPAGYIHTLIQRSIIPDQDLRIDDYLEGALGFNMVAVGGMHIWTQDVVGMSTTMLDPTAALPHIVDNIVTNLGTASLIGSISDIGILESVGTEPFPTTKVVKCKWCDFRKTVPQETTKLICPECGKLTLYYSLSKLRHGP